MTGTRAVYGTSTNAELADTTNIVRLHVHVSRDDGASWLYGGGIEWRGGSQNKDGTWNRPGLITSDVELLRGALVRIEVDLPQPIRLGAEVVYTP